MSFDMVYLKGEEPRWDVAVGAKWMEVHGDQLLRLPDLYRVGLGFEAAMEAMVCRIWRRPRSRGSAPRPGVQRTPSRFMSLSSA
ncbi:MAG: hypothetical protein IV100_14465 [Myxococcales bacterium]|nr:hypothetical protein [Myxococcales bacterium]